MNARDLERELSGVLDGEVRFDEQSRALYSTDSSNYRQVPIGVVVPKSKEDIIQTMRLCRAHGVPVLSRGGGTSLAGQCCNVAVVMDMSKYYNRILDLNPGEKWARVQPGLVLDELREAAEKFHLTFGPDPSTHSRCTLGGMIGNNSCGVHSVIAGRTADNVLELEVLTYDGTILTVSATSAAELESRIRHGGREGEIYARLKDLRDRVADLVRKRYPRIPRRVSGYNLDDLLPENGFDLAKALVGSEGTCVCVLEAKVRLVHSPRRRALVLAGFEDLSASADAVPRLMGKGPIGLEGIDDLLVEHMRKKHLHVGNLQLLPRGSAWLLVEVGADTEEDLQAQLRAMRKAAEACAGATEAKCIVDPRQQKRIWEIRESGLGATAFVPGEPVAWEGWEDSAVPPERLASYLRDLRALFEKYGYQAALYGHFGQGCVHCRINFDLQTAEGIDRYHSFTREASQLVAGYGGSISGEHGDGQSKAEFLPILYGEELVRAFEEFKGIWDPDQKMNPGKVVKPWKNTENLRLGKTYRPWDPSTVFQFPEDEHSFAHAALRCVGVGACRQHKGGVICPSYQATREEKHSTRGRARLLFEMLEGETIPPRWRNEAVKDALDLCLSCKGCKGECPVNVDMATYKAEFLHHYYKRRLRPRHAYAMGFIAPLSALAAHFPRMANFFTHSGMTAPAAKWLAGIHQAREIPRFAEQTFRNWFREHSRQGAAGQEPVVLWPDTFTNYFHPQVGISAVRVLEAAGFRVVLPGRQFCCGRPLYDFGFLRTAKSWLLRILAELRPEIQNGLPFVFLEPSCTAVFRDELLNLLPNDQDARRLKNQSYLLSEFLTEKAPHFSWPKLAGRALVQGHCHHRSVLKFGEERQLISRVIDSVEVVPSSCCGMAGSFGFEAEHYGLSQELGSHALFPAVRSMDEFTYLLANGFSCREQIRQATGKQALHLSQLLELSLAGQQAGETGQDFEIAG